MEKYFDLLCGCELFKGLSHKQISLILEKLSTSVKSYKKSQYIYLQGETISSIGIILNGSVQIISTDYFGNDSIYSAMAAGDMFGEALFALPSGKMPFNILSVTESKILFIEQSKLFSDTFKIAEHDILIKNLICILAEKALKFRQTIEHVTRRTTRQKILSYLSYMATSQSSDSFFIPFNRQQLADYLAVERSALSAELSRMQSDDLIKYKKNHFIIKHNKSQ